MGMRGLSRGTAQSATLGPIATVAPQFNASGRKGNVNIRALLARVSLWIRRPFGAFSDKVAPAVVEKRQLKAQTTCGTSMRCVLAHIQRTSPATTIVVTDGYIESLDRDMVRAAVKGTRLTECRKSSTAEG